jgi:predicted pyridoxine 5'-phosphate oxidase superfamily flavin-nucleotide-binding protein
MEVERMIPEKMMQVLKHEGVVAIATQGDEGPHLVNTWNSYLQVTETGSLLIPAGYMHATEANLAKNPKVLVTFGSREVEGFHGPGTGFLVEGTAVFLSSGPIFDAVKARFPWARAALEITVACVTQTL